MEVNQGIPHSPYFIFINGLSDKSDVEVLSLLELHTAEKVEHNESLMDKECIYISRDANWVHIMDNWFYSHWHSKELRQKIDELGKKQEIFTCSIGDCDLSFDFKYFAEGRKLREYIVQSPNFNNQIIMTDSGVPLPAENIGVKKKDPLDKVMYIARSLGIVLPGRKQEISCYRLL